MEMHREGERARCSILAQPHDAGLPVWTCAAVCDRAHVTAVVLLRVAPALDAVSLAEDRVGLWHTCGGALIGHRVAGFAAGAASTVDAVAAIVEHEAALVTARGDRAVAGVGGAGLASFACAAGDIARVIAAVVHGERAAWGFSHPRSGLTELGVGLGLALRAGVICAACAGRATSAIDRASVTAVVRVRERSALGAESLAEGRVRLVDAATLARELVARER